MTPSTPSTPLDHEDPKDAAANGNAAVLRDRYAVNLHDRESIKHGLVHCLITVVGRDPAYATTQDWYAALVYLLRGALSQSMTGTGRRIHQTSAKRVYYLSLEYLPGRFLPKILFDLGVRDDVVAALGDFGIDLDDLRPHECDIALGNGGLGRLAACFLDAMATHGYPGYGYGIRYEFGLFSQTIEDGRQVEHPEPWLRYGDPWQFKRPGIICPVHFGGRLNRATDTLGRDVCQWVDTEDVIALAYDLPIPGYRSDMVVNLRLWAARSSRDFDLSYFNEGNYMEAVREKTHSESLSKVLYPHDATAMGQELRLKQEYFFVSASLQDILKRFLKSHDGFDTLADKIAIQLNDTHPSLAIPELMRLLVDHHGVAWADAWAMTSTIVNYTCHTLLPEALETWPIAMLERVLPRHLDIIYRINHEHLREVKHAFPGDSGKLGGLSLVDDQSRRIRMAHLAIVGSRRVNGVSELQSALLREAVFPDFARMWPDKFTCVTNGITPRRWLLIANPGLARLIDARIDADWPTRLELLEGLLPSAEDGEFRAAFRQVKQDNKGRLARLIGETTGLTVDPASMFDVQVKRIHEYKRQLLNLMHVITRYNRIKDGRADLPPRTVIIGGKAAPGYHMAKLIIRLIGDVADIVNNDPDVRDLLKLVFVPDYKVSTAEIVIPGADLSEQISTAGTEASGTGNMKFALNGALTIGTLDGANIEIHKAVNGDNMFIFGLTADQVTELRAQGYNPWDRYEGNDELKRVVDMIGDGFFCAEEPDRYAPVRDALLAGGDHYLVLADYADYVACQARVDDAFADADDWTRKAIVNVGHMGRFSSDRAIHQYARTVWDIAPLDGVSDRAPD